MFEERVSDEALFVGEFEGGSWKRAVKKVCPCVKPLCSKQRRAHSSAIYTLSQIVRML